MVAFNASSPVSLLLTVALIAASTAAYGATVCTTDGARHECAARGDPLEACLGVLQNNPRNHRARLTLCQIHLEQQQLTQAHQLLDQGLNACTRNQCSELRLLLSNIEEMQQRLNDTDPEGTRMRQASLRGYCTGPITSTRTIDACRELLITSQNDLDLHLALATKLAKRDQPVDAIRVLDVASAISPDHPELARILEAAHNARRELAGRCIEGSLTACENALLTGADDEFDLQFNLGKLLISGNETAAGAQALLIAQTLAPEDREVARVIVNLNQVSVPGIDLLAAKRQANMTLGISQVEADALQQMLATSEEVEYSTVAADNQEDAVQPVAAIAYLNDLTEDGRSH